MGVIKLGEEEFETVPEISLFASKELVDMWERLGRPESPLTESGEKLMKVIIAVWEELYPEQVKHWTEDRKQYKVNELTTKEQIYQHTGRSLASYPYPVFMMMKKLFPNFRPVDRANCMKMVRKFPMFSMANKV
jgi:hypothetical protein